MIGGFGRMSGIFPPRLARVITPITAMGAISVGGGRAVPGAKAGAAGKIPGGFIDPARDP
jgi:hypothetical protein